MYRPTERDIQLDRQVSIEALACDVWQGEDGIWYERIYGPLSDGYWSSERPLPAYTDWFEHTLDLKEEVYSRCGHRIQAPVYDYRAVCLEVLALNGAARWHPSQALVERIEQSQWKEAGRWKVPVRDVIYGPYGTVEAAHIYILWHAGAYQPMYIGQTKVGVKKRLRLHMASKGAIGRALATAKPAFADWTVEVVAIRCNGYNSLNTAESCFIEEYQPIYNRQK